MNDHAEQPVRGGTGRDASSDHSLLRRFRQGSEDAATQLYLRYANRVYRLAQAQCPPDLTRRVDADDIVQSVFSSLFRRVRQGDYDVPAGEELWKLLLVITLNKIRAQGNFHRAACRDVRLTAPASPDTAVAAGADSDGPALAFLKLVIDELLQRLPEPHREMILLRIDGHEVAEVAARTRRSKRSVERVLQEFRRHLAAELHEG